MELPEPGRAGSPNPPLRAVFGEPALPNLPLVNRGPKGILKKVNGTWSKLLPVIFVFLAALSRWPGLFPPNFSAFYALSFCAGAFFPRTLKWWVPLGTLVVTDIALDFYYQSFSAMQFVNYIAFAGIILFGSRFNHRSRFLSLLSGGIFGAVLFYLITNTGAWLFDPAYTKDLAGWIIALTKGTSGYPTTIEFFRNTLLSGGLFTGIFAGAMKLSEAREPAEEAEEKPAEEPKGEPAPEEGKA